MINVILGNKLRPCSLSREPTGQFFTKFDANCESGLVSKRLF